MVWSKKGTLNFVRKSAMSNRFVIGVWLIPWKENDMVFFYSFDSFARISNISVNDRQTCMVSAQIVQQVVVLILCRVFIT